MNGRQAGREAPPGPLEGFVMDLADEAKHVLLLMDVLHPTLPRLTAG